MLNIRWQLIGCLLMVGLFAHAQSNDLLVEKLKQQVQTAYQNEGRDKALSLALLGNDCLAPDHPEMQRLLYETYYLSSGYDDYYDEGYDYIETGFQCADWSPDGKTLAVGTSDGMIHFYEFGRSGAPTKTSFKTMATSVLDLAFSPDGTKLATGDADSYTRIYDLASKEAVQSWQHLDYIRSVAWAPDGSLLASGGDENTVYIYNPISGEIVEEFSGHTDWIRGISWSKSGEYIAAASDDGTATVWSITAGDLLKTHSDHTDYCRDVVFSPTTEQLLTVSDDLNGYIYNNGGANFPEKTLSGHEGWIMTADWSSDGQYVATADNNSTVIIHNMRNDDQQFYNDPGLEVSWADIDFASDNSKIAVTTTDHITILEVGESQPRYTIDIDGDVGTEESESSLDDLLGEYLPRAVQIFPSPDGSKLGIIDGDYNVQVIDLENSRLLYSISDHTDWVRNIDWSKDGRLLATASDDMMVGIWDAETGEMQHFLSGHSDWVRDVGFSADSRVLVSAGDDGVLRSWDTSSGEELTVTNSIESFLMTVDWSPNEQFIASQDSEGYLHIWNAKNNAKVFTSDVYTIAGTAEWSKDNTLNVMAMDEGLMNWSAGNGLVEIEGASSGVVSSRGATATAKGSYIAVVGSRINALLEGHLGNVTKMDWSNDGTYLISQDDAGYIGIWNPSKSQMIARLQFGDGTPKTIVWSPDGQSFYFPGCPDRLILNPAEIRTRIEDNYTVWPLLAEDVKYYELYQLVADNASAKSGLLANGDTPTLVAFAEFFENRAEVQPAASAASADKATAKSFRDASND